MKAWQYMWILVSQGEEPRPEDRQDVRDWFLFNGIDPVRCLTDDRDDPIGHADNVLELPKDFPLAPDFVELVKGRYAAFCPDTLDAFLDSDIRPTKEKTR